MVMVHKQLDIKHKVI